MLPKFQRTRATLALFAGTALVIAGCSSSNDPTDPIDPEAVEGLSIAEQMSVVTVEESAAPGASSTPAGTDPTEDFAPDADYNSDVSRAHVYDPSMEALQTVNMILCVLKQTAYSGLVNEGLYKAQVDMAACEAGGDSGDSQTGQSSGTDQNLGLWIVSSERDSNTSAQIVECWLPPEAHGDGGALSQIRARLVITDKVTDENPFGVFDLNWIDIEVEGGAVSGFGNLHSLDVADGFIGFSFYEEGGDVTQPAGPGEYAYRTQANVNMFVDQTQGVAHIIRQERDGFSGVDSGLVETEFRLAFDPDNVLRGQDDDAPVCLSRTDFQQRTWRYNLYDATTGARVDLDGGFGFRTEEGDYGWVGYWGLWVNSDVELETGDVVERDTFGSATPEVYTVLSAPGKLIKNTRHTLDLTAIAGMQFEWWDHSEPGQPPAHVLIEYVEGAWYAMATYDSEGQTWEDLEPPVEIDLEFGYLGFYSQALGGPCSYVDGDAFITYFARETVTPTSDVFGSGETIDLYGYFQCLAAEISGEDAEMGQIYLTDSADVGTPYHFTFDQDGMALLLVVDEASAQVGLADGETITTGPYTWGMQSGPMVLSTEGLSSPFDVYAADVFYTYETGPNHWNKYQTLLDDTLTAVTFDPPVQFSYTHATANDANGDATHDGRTFLLQYEGAGSLHGIPHEGVDLDGDGDDDRYYPLFSLADGTLMGPTGSEYVVRAIESEYTLDEDVGGCGGLDIGSVGDLEVPDADSWTDPDMGSTPVVNDPPRVIEGEVLGSDS